MSNFSSEEMTRPAIDSCWNRIGVQGDRSCPELRTYVHCRNCPVHARGALELLEREPPAGMTDEWTEYFAKPKESGRKQTEAMVVFRLGAEWLGLPASSFEEIISVRPVHVLPHRDESVVAGLVNVRGELLAALALARVLGVQEPSERSGSQRQIHRRMLVLRRQRDRMVFAVDEVDGIFRHATEELQEVPATVARSQAAYTRAIWPDGDRVVGCLDDGRLFQTFNRSLA